MPPDPPTDGGLTATQYTQIVDLKVYVPWPDHFKSACYGPVHTMPEEVRQCFESGAFICNITGYTMQSVALDEAHEMLINSFPTIAHARYYIV